jgi:hypothetical protein
MVINLEVFQSDELRRSDRKFTSVDKMIYNHTTSESSGVIAIMTSSRNLERDFQF